MARVGDKVTLSLECRLKPVEHLVQRLTQSLYLVAGRRDREPFTGSLGGDRRGASTHRLHLPQRKPGKQIADPGGEDQRDRAGDQQLVAKARKRFGVVLSGRADDEHRPPASMRDGRGEQTRPLVETGHRRHVEVGWRSLCGAQLYRGKERFAAERSCRVEYAPIRGDQLRVALAALHQAAAAVAGERRLGVADKRGQVLRAQLQLAVEREREMRGEPQVEEEARAGKNCGHRKRERRRHPQPDRQPAHGASSPRSR